MTKRKVKEHDDNGTPSLVDLAKQLESAMTEAELKKEAVDDAKDALDTVTQEYAAAAGIVTGLANQMQAMLRDILSNGGTMHVAQ